MAHDQRPVRLQLELQKPETILRQHKIRFTIVVFGGTRIIEPAVAQARLAQVQAEIARDGADPGRARRLAIAERVVAKAKYYEEAREFSRLVAESYRRAESEYVVVTGGGRSWRPRIAVPGSRRAEHRSQHHAADGATRPNSTSRRRCASSSTSRCARCIPVARPSAGGVPGRLRDVDELFEALTLMQTGKTRVMPVILFGREFWDGVLDFQYLADEGTISDQDLQLFHYAGPRAWEIIRAFHASKPRYGRGTSTRELRRREDAREPGEPTPTA
jgi:predicted Rossmann-fold nucleotide-binding protein